MRAFRRRTTGRRAQPSVQLVGGRDVATPSARRRSGGQLAAQGVDASRQITAGKRWIAGRRSTRRRSRPR